MHTADGERKVICQTAAGLISVRYINARDNTANELKFAQARCRDDKESGKSFSVLLNIKEKASLAAVYNCS